MTIKRGSRYEYATIDFVQKTENGDLIPVLFYTLDLLNTLSYTEYTWKDNDRLDLLAYEAYGKPSFWWVIIEHNPEIKDLENIEPGTVLRIPRAV